MARINGFIYFTFRDLTNIICESTGKPVVEAENVGRTFKSNPGGYPIKKIYDIDEKIRLSTNLFNFRMVDYGFEVNINSLRIKEYKLIENPVVVDESFIWIKYMYSKFGKEYAPYAIDGIKKVKKILVDKANQLESRKKVMTSDEYQEASVSLAGKIYELSQFVERIRADQASNNDSHNDKE